MCEKPVFLHNCSSHQTGYNRPCNQQALLVYFHEFDFDEISVYLRKLR